MGSQERITVDAQDPCRKLKEAGREYFDEPENNAPPEFRQVICNADGFLELLYYSKEFPENRDWLRARTFELARRQLSQDKVDEALNLAQKIYDAHNQSEDRPQISTSHKANKTNHPPKKASIDTTGLEPDVLDRFQNRYFNSPIRESLKRNLGERRYHSLQEIVGIFISEGKITKEQCAEFSLQTIIRIGREIVSQAKGRPIVFQTTFKRPIKPS